MGCPRHSNGVWKPASSTRQEAFDHPDVQSASRLQSPGISVVSTSTSARLGPTKCHSPRQSLSASAKSCRGEGRSESPELPAAVACALRSQNARSATTQRESASCATWRSISRSPSPAPAGTTSPSGATTPKGSQAAGSLVAAPPRPVALSSKTVSQSHLSKGSRHSSGSWHTGRQA